jgi:hypothetical protein
VDYAEGKRTSGRRLSVIATCARADTWFGMTSYGHTRRVPHLNPKSATDVWLVSSPDSIGVVFAGHQVCVQKIADDTQITDMAYWNELSFDHVQSHSTTSN